MATTVSDDKPSENMDKPPDTSADMVVSDISDNPDIEKVDSIKTDIEKGDIEMGIVETNKEEIVTTDDIEAGIEVPTGAPLNQVGLIPPPRTPGGRLLLAPATPKLNSDQRPSKPPSQFEKLEKLRTVAAARIEEFARNQPNVHDKFKNMYKSFHSSTVGVWMTKLDFWLEKHLSHHLR